MAVRHRASVALLVIEAYRNLIAARQRSLLALLGLSVGTAAVIGMINIGDNAAAEAKRSFEEMGTDIASVSLAPGDPSQPIGFSESTILQIRRAVPSILDLVPIAIANATTTVRERSMSVQIVGTIPRFFSLARLKLSSGRFLTAFDKDEMYAVVGSRVDAQLSPSRVGADHENKVEIGQGIFEPIGEIAEAAYSPILPLTPHEVIIVPLSTMRRVMNPYWASTLLVQFVPGVNESKATEELRRTVAELLPNSSAYIVNAEQLLEAMQRQVRIYTLLLAAMGAISLLVGGVGVMNIMLISIIERRQEIGIRLAIGARPADIKLMFLTESLALAVVGGLAGSVAGLVMAYGFARYSGWEFSLSAYAIPFGIGMSSITGTVFGYYPASRAAKLNPVDALRAS